ncbi:MAG: 3-hydroxybutyryl-CoA dehydrogenase [Thermoleophilales bacterium]|nr:3-hydroxybutyryl-CoA dehydrogenase [Thermoleophilales bacterium]
MLGTGIMGSGIAQLAAMNGYDAVGRDLGEEQLGLAAAAVEKSLGRFVKAGRLSEDDAAAARGRLRFTTDLPEALDGADVVIEAVPEILALKQELLGQAIELAPPDALLGTNTSQLSITVIAAALGESAPRLVGVHFFNPPVMMRLVELICGALTAPAELDRAKRFAQSLDREVVVCRKDSPGFITSRAYAILRLECMRMVEEGVATPEDIDRALRLGFNFPMGPLELGDMNGLDTYLHALTSLAEAHGDRFRPTVGLRNMVAANRLGRKTGAGFYEYGPDGTRVS